MFNGMFDELKDIKQFKKITDLKSFKMSNALKK